MSQAPQLYRGPLLDELTLGLLRPGGLELTLRALDRLGLSPGARVLDVGCGLGATAGCLAQRGFATLGVDRDATLLRRAAHRHPQVPFVQGEGDALPFASGSFHGAFLECTLSIVPHPRRLLRELHRVLAPGGSLAVTDLFARSRGSLWAARAAAPTCAATLMSLDELTCCLLDSRFEVLELEDHSKALAALMGQLIFQHGSTRPLWALACASRGSPEEAERALKDARPGYLLMVARRGASSDAGEDDEAMDSPEEASDEPA